MLTFQAIFSYNRCQSRCYIRRKQSNLHLYISGEAPALTITAPSCSVLSFNIYGSFPIITVFISRSCGDGDLYSASQYFFWIWSSLYPYKEEGTVPGYCWWKVARGTSREGSNRFLMSTRSYQNVISFCTLRWVGGDTSLVWLTD